MGLGYVPGRELSYGLRLGLVAVLLVWARRWWPPLGGPGRPLASVGAGLAAGAAGAVLWVALLRPFLPAEAAEPWTATAWALRLAAAGLLVPFCEELLCRGYVLRLVVQWQQARGEGVDDPLGTALDERDVRTVEPGAWTVPAVALSTLLFVLGHAPPEYAAATAYGLLMASLWVWRRDLLTCVVAHGVSNAVLAGWVLHRGAWELW